MKTEFKGTKGDWYVDKNAMTVTTKELVDGDIVCDAPEGFIESMENWKANAKLIAAAPDLLEALKKSVISMKLADEVEFADEIYQAEEVINKALK
tara:strand:+ start:632 stop:916 length:285 start_codon:yes stop_codon:yes gene_type:complete